MRWQTFLDLDNPTYRDLLYLRSGTDQWSRLYYDDLKAKLSEEEVRIVAERIENTVEQSKAMRWILRGLSPELAATKVVMHIRMEEPLFPEQQETHSPSHHEEQAHTEAPEIADEPHEQKQSKKTT